MLLSCACGGLFEALFALIATGGVAAVPAAIQLVGKRILR